MNTERVNTERVNHRVEETGKLSTRRVGEMGILSVEEIGVGEMGDTPKWARNMDRHVV